jgi:Family of unknown function (DUF6155)
MTNLVRENLARYLARLKEPQLREEILRLFDRLESVEELYAQELKPAAAQPKQSSPLDAYKKKVTRQYYDREGSPKIPGNQELKRLLKEFEKTSAGKADVVDLALYRVEIAVRYADEFEGMPASDYASVEHAYEKALKLIAEYDLKDQFRERCLAITTGSGDPDPHFKKALEALSHGCFGA